MTRLDRTAALADIVAEHSATARVFLRHDIDLQLRGDATVLEACREHDLDPVEVFAQLEDATAAEPWQVGPSSRLADGALVAHLVERHRRARRALPYIDPLLTRVASFEARRKPSLDELCDVGHALVERLDDQMDAEERELFPALLGGTARRAALRRGIQRLCGAHRDVRALLARVRALAGGFTVPDWASRSQVALMGELEELEDEVLEHMHLEAYVFLPRLSRRYREVAS